MNTFYFCTVLGASAAVALWREDALNRPLSRLPQPLSDVVPPEPEATPSGQPLLRGGLTGEQTRPGETAPADPRSRSIAASLAPLARVARNRTNIMVAALAGIVACVNLADGTGIGPWLLPCVGIPLIVAGINLLGPGDR